MTVLLGHLLPGTPARCSFAFAVLCSADPSSSFLLQHSMVWWTHSVCHAPHWPTVHYSALADTCIKSLGVKLESTKFLFPLISKRSKLALDPFFQCSEGDWKLYHNRMIVECLPNEISASWLKLGIFCPKPDWLLSQSLLHTNGMSLQNFFVWEPLNKERTKGSFRDRVGLPGEREISLLGLPWLFTLSFWLVGKNYSS